MSKYRLKDAALQKKLDEISDGDFTDVLNANDLEFDEDGMTDIAFGSSIHGKTFIAEKFSVTLLKDEIIFQYDPEAWNSFPEVTPPEGVLMRVEFVYNGILRRNCAIFENGAWHITAEGKADYDHLTLDDVKRFRPWE